MGNRMLMMGFIDYKVWRIQPSYYIEFEAYDLNDCDAPIIFAKTVEELKAEIDERQ